MRKSASFLWAVYGLPLLRLQPDLAQHRHAGIAYCLRKPTSTRPERGASLAPSRDVAAGLAQEVSQ